MTYSNSQPPQGNQRTSDALPVIEDDGDDSGVTKAKRYAWRVMIVDDDPEVHAATRFALGRCVIAGRMLEFLSAHSAQEGKVLLQEDTDVAVVLLDVVMEQHDSGLKFVEWMRESGFSKQRIILRTGQTGYAPELDVIRNYDINDYRAKSELTQTRLITSITAAIRSYEQLCIVDEQRFQLERFSYALAHDFKQTTRQIVTFSALLMRSHEQDLMPGEHRSLLYLNAAARRLGALVDALSQYTLLNRPPEAQTIDIEEMFAGVQDAVESMVKDAGGKLTMTGAGAFRGHPALVGQVLQILIANGLEHNDKLNPELNVSFALERDLYVISVSDNGMGIETQHLEAIFEPHMRLRSSSDLPGTGLGLSLSRRAIEAIGGSLDCKSAPGVGSTFRLSFPTALESAPPASVQ